MVKYAESWIERFVNKLVLISLLLLVVLLVMEFTIKDPAYRPYLDMADFAINIVFIADLFFIFKKSHSLRGFFTKNWLDIIACIPFSSAFRAVKLIRFTRFAKLAAKESKFASRLSKAHYLRHLNAVKTSKLLSEETEVEKHIDMTKDTIFDMQIRKIDRQMDAITKKIRRLQEN